VFTHEVIGTSPEHLNSQRPHATPPDLPTRFTLVIQLLRCTRSASHLLECVLAPYDDDLAPRQNVPDILIQKRLLESEPKRHAIEQPIRALDRVGPRDGLERSGADRAERRGACARRGTIQQRGGGKGGRPPREVRVCLLRRDPGVEAQDALLELIDMLTQSVGGTF